MKKILLLISAFILTSSINPAIAQQSVLDYELVPKERLENWVNNYGFTNLDALAENGDPIAQRRLGRYYAFIKNDYQTAVKWYKTAASSGDYFAQTNLGACYLYGNGVAIDKDNALRWFIAGMKSEPYGEITAFSGMSAIKGSKWAQERYGQWYLEDASRGNAISQYNLAFAYSGGNMFDSNLGLAKKWYQKAADQGFEPAIKALEELNDDDVSVEIGTLVNGNGYLNEYIDGTLINKIPYVDGKIKDGFYSMKPVWNDPYVLNNLAWGVYVKADSDINELESAILWIKRSIELDRKFFNTETYAYLLYETGHYEQALIMAKEALRLGKMIDDDTSKTEELIEHIMQI